MKILLLVDYYSPFNPGGSEWSTYYLAVSLKKRGVDASIFTPNYGARNKEVLNGIRVARFKTPYRVKNNRAVINPVLQNNPWFFLISALEIIKYTKKEKPDVLQVNGKFLIPGALIASKILKIPLVVSIRDKQLLCSYGWCFFTKGRYKRCGWSEYLTKDLAWFYRNYVKKKTPFTFFYTFFSAIWTRWMNDTIASFAKRADKIIAISKSQKKYLQANGFKKIEVIYNSVEFPPIEFNGKRKGVLYAGKLSLGKGVYELLKAIPRVVQKYNQKFYFAGGIDNISKIEQMIKEEKIKKDVELLGGVEHFKLQKLYQSTKLVVMPSTFPEAFGRVALEALAAGTPVVVSDRGGLPEIIEDGVTGIVTDGSSDKLADAIQKVLKANLRFLNNVKKRKKELEIKFGVGPIEKHIKIYRKLIR